MICGAVGVIAEVDGAALDKRHAQGWVMEKISDMDELVARIKVRCVGRVPRRVHGGASVCAVRPAQRARTEREAVSIGFHGNVVAVWERLAAEEELLVDLGSDQTSLHNPLHGGYFPVQVCAWRRWQCRAAPLS